MRKLIFVGVMLITIVLSQNRVKAVGSAVAIQPPDNIQSIRKSNTSIRIKWRTVSDADGYIIYRCKPSSKKYVKIHTVSCSKAGVRKQWTDKKLKKNKIYKYKISSYKNENGEQVESSLSDWVSTKTYERGKKKINARTPELDKKEIYLGLCSSKKLTCYVEPAKYGKHKKKKALSTKVRWRSSDTSVATVDRKGNITAKAKAGKCNVYAIAHNGLRAKVKVTVKNYARVKGYYNYNKGEDICALVTDYKTLMQNIAEYYSIHRPKRDEIIRFCLNDEAEVVVTPENVNIENIKKDIETLLVDFPYQINITVYPGSIDFRTHFTEDEKDSYREVSFFFDNNCKEWTSIRIASHWTGYNFYPM